MIAVMVAYWRSTVYVINIIITEIIMWSAHLLPSCCPDRSKVVVAKQHLRRPTTLCCFKLWLWGLQLQHWHPFCIYSVRRKKDLKQISLLVQYFFTKFSEIFLHTVCHYCCKFYHLIFRCLEVAQL